MDDNAAINCADIQKRIKPFLDDLLAEDEYQAFISHLNTCSKCSNYVSSIGALSNQVWELGKVKVPSDFSSTVLFNLQHPEQITESRPSGSKKNLLIGSVVLIAGIACIFFAINYFGKRYSATETNDKPFVRSEVIVDRKSSAKSEAQSLLNELQSIAANLGVAAKKETAEKETEKSTAKEEGSQTKNQPPVAASAQNIKTRPLHWHILLSEKTDDAPLASEKRQKEQDMQKMVSEKKLIEDEIQHLKEQDKIELGRVYSEEPKPTSAQEKYEEEAAIINIEQQMNAVEARRGQYVKANKFDEANREQLLYAQLAESYAQEIKKVRAKGKDGIGILLQQKIKRNEDADASMRNIEQEISAIDMKIRRMPEERKRAESGREDKLADAFNNIGARPNRQMRSQILFTCRGKVAEQAIEQIFANFQNSAFHDFSSNVVTFPDNEYRVSIYLEKGDPATLHWHVGPIAAKQRADILDIFRKQGCNANYESEELVIFSVPASEVDKLRRQVLAKRVNFSEFDNSKTAGNELASGSKDISIYFQSGK